MTVESSPEPPDEALRGDSVAGATFVDMTTNDSDAEDHRHRVPDRQSWLFLPQSAHGDFFEAGWCSKEQIRCVERRFGGSCHGGRATRRSW